MPKYTYTHHNHAQHATCESTKCQVDRYADGRHVFTDGTFVTKQSKADFYNSSDQGVVLHFGNVDPITIKDDTNLRAEFVNLTDGQKAVMQARLRAIMTELYPRRGVLGMRFYPGGDSGLRNTFDGDDEC